MPERDDLVDLPGLARFGAALEDAARRDEARLAADEPRAVRTPGRRWPHGLTLVLLALVGTTATAAATAAALRATVIPAPDPRVLPADQASLARSALLVAPRSADPAGGPPWALRLTRSQTGQTCTTVGQLRDGAFGIVGIDGVFRLIPATVVDSCGRGLLLGSRVVSAPTAATTRSIVFGVAGAGTRRAVLVTATARRTLRLGARGSFVAALRGYPEDSAVSVELTAADGRVRRHALGARPGLVPDIGGAPAWRLDRYELGTRQFCAHIGDARRPTDRDPSTASDMNGGASTAPTACIARRGRFAWAAQALRLRAGQRGSAGFDRWSYGRRPPRTLLLGVARTSTAVTSVTVRGAGAPRVLTPTSRGVFALLLPAKVDPAGLRLSVRLRDGAVESGRSGHGIVPDLVASRRPR